MRDRFTKFTVLRTTVAVARDKLLNSNTLNPLHPTAGPPQRERAGAPPAPARSPLKRGATPSKERGL